MAGVKGRSGGRRVGAGRKAKSAEKKALGGHAGHHGNAATRRAAAAAGKRRPLRKTVRPPIDLAPEQVAVWAELASFATALGTLTQASELAFRDLCEAICVKRALLRQVMAEGWTIGSPGQQKAHPLLVRYQGIYQRIEAGLTRFGLSPMGEEMGFGKPPSTAAGGPGVDEGDPFAEFDGPAH